MKDILLKEEILKNLGVPIKCENLFVLDTVSSTNFFCRKLIMTNAVHRTVVIADSQTEGRGRLGRQFFSPKGTGIYMSIIFDSAKTIIPQNLVTIIAGIAVCRVITNFIGKSVKIKWVNDIFFNGKKVCGILAENIAASNSHNYYILGIGINVSTPDTTFPGELKETASSLFPQDITRNEIIARVINELDAVFSETNTSSIIEEYKKYSLCLGKKIEFTQNGKSYSGTATDVNMEGNLIVALENGEKIILKSGEVSLGSENFTG